jgi:hypothetical protein
VKLSSIGKTIYFIAIGVVSFFSLIHVFNKVPILLDQGVSVSEIAIFSIGFIAFCFVFKKIMKANGLF